MLPVYWKCCFKILSEECWWKEKYILCTNIEGIFADKAKVDLGFFFVCGHTQSVYGKIDSF